MTKRETETWTEKETASHRERQTVGSTCHRPVSEASPERGDVRAAPSESATDATPLPCAAGSPSGTGGRGGEEDLAWGPSSDSPGCRNRERPSVPSDVRSLPLAPPEISRSVSQLARVGRASVSGDGTLSKHHRSACPSRGPSRAGPARPSALPLRLGQGQPHESVREVRELPPWSCL